MWTKGVALVDELVVDDIERHDLARNARCHRHDIAVRVGVVGPDQVLVRKIVVDAVSDEQQRHDDRDRDDQRTTALAAILRLLAVLARGLVAAAGIRLALVVLVLVVLVLVVLGFVAFAGLIVVGRIAVIVASDTTISRSPTAAIVLIVIAAVVLPALFIAAQRVAADIVVAPLVTAGAAIIAAIISVAVVSPSPRASAFTDLEDVPPGPPPRITVAILRRSLVGVTCGHRGFIRDKPT